MRLLKNKIFLENLLIAFFLLSLSARHFLAVFRQGNPYTSDSMFYKHLYYQFQGDDFSEAKKKVAERYQIDWGTEAENQIFSNEKSYISSYPFFANRVLYPFSAYLVNLLLDSEHLAFFLPIFLSYLGILVILFNFLRKRLGVIFSFVAIVLLIRFPPFIVSMTQYMTDSIGLFLWLLQIIFLAKFFKNGSLGVFTVLSGLFVLSMLNREYAFLFAPASVIVYFLKKKSLGFFELKNFRFAIFGFFILGAVYFSVSAFLDGPTILDYYHRVQNKFGLLNNQYSLFQTAKFWVGKVLASHALFLNHLEVIWYLRLFFFIGLFFTMVSLIWDDLDIFESFLVGLSIFSYLLMLIFPNFSYRYFLITIITFLYFTLKNIKLFVTLLRQ